METEEKKGSPPPAETKREQAKTKADTVSTKREQAETKADAASTKREQKRTFRLAPVQKTRAADPGFGQVSRETMPEIAEVDTVPKPDKKAQAMGILSPEQTQNVGTGQNPRVLGDGSGEGRGVPLHEITSEFGEGVHEITSEFRGRARETAHETTSEFPVGLHDTTSALAEAVARRLVEGLRRANWVRGG